MADDEIFRMIAEERRDLAALLDGLNDAQWETPSLCEGWRVREVVSHLTMPFSVSLIEVGLRMLFRRGDFNRVADEWARKDKRSNTELIGALRDNADNRFTPPGAGPEAPLTDIMTHAQDICRPLGIGRPVSARHAEVALCELVSQKGKRFFGGVVIDGLAFASTDTGWRHGEGPEVVGPAAALITTLARRTAALDELSGAGARTLRERLRA